MSNILIDKDISDSSVDEIIFETQEIQKKSDKLFTRREWILRYSSAFRSLMFMSFPMIVITIVNAAYGLIDKQLTLNYAIGDVETFIRSGLFSGILPDGVVVNSSSSEEIIKKFAMELINVSTQYSNTIIFLLNALSMLTAIGCAIKWGQAMGQRNKEKMDSILISGILQAAILSILGVIILHFVAPLLITSQANVKYSDRNTDLQYMLANDYIQKFIYGFPLLVVSTFISTMLRTEGKVWWVIPMNVTAICINIGSGILIMTSSSAGHKMEGAVYGSMIAWAFIVIVGLLIIIFSKNTLLRPHIKNIKLNIKESLQIWFLGLSPFISNLVFAILNYTLTYLITTVHDAKNVYESLFITFNVSEQIQITSAVSPALRVLSAGAPWSQVLWAPIIGIMQGGTANYAYNKGAEKRFRILQIYKTQVLLASIWAVIVEFILLFLGGKMLEFFNGPADKGIWMFYYLNCFMFLGISFSTMSLLQGVGNPIGAAGLSLMRSLVLSLIFSIIGWVIAKNINNPMIVVDGKNLINAEGDKWIFIMIGLTDFPASLLAICLVYFYAKGILKKNRMQDVKDNFVAPSYLVANINEVQIASNLSISRIELKLAKILESKKYKDNHDAQIEIRNKYEIMIEKIQSLRDKKIEKVSIKYKLFDYNISSNPKENELNKIHRIYETHVTEISNKIHDASYKEKVLFELAEKNKIHVQKIEEKYNKIFNHQKKIIEGEHISPFAILFMKVEPQPINQ